MQRLIFLSKKKTENTSVGFRRYLFGEIDWNERLLVVTGSSILELSQGREDLSRRAAVYHLAGLSYTEFLQLRHGLKFDVLPIEEILKTHHEISSGYHDRADIFKTFSEYLRNGYYPFFNEGYKPIPKNSGR